MQNQKPNRNLMLNQNQKRKLKQKLTPMEH
jgi:hypothetical protein